MVSVRLSGRLAPTIAEVMVVLASTQAMERVRRNSRGRARSSSNCSMVSKLVMPVVSVVDRRGDCADRLRGETASVDGRHAVLP